MNCRLVLIPVLLLLAVSARASVAQAASAPNSAHPLVWDATEKSLEPKEGETVAEFEFVVVNRSDKPVQIDDVRPTCGCTVVDLPAKPWVLEAGAKGSFRALVDFTGKAGRFVKGAYVISPAGTQLLNMVVNIPDTPEAARLRNQQLALHDRQAVFRGDCASCHATPAQGKTGGELFAAACAVCHMAAHRASMVPDLATAREPRDAAYWRRWITEGKEKTLMPAFAEKHGGPLTESQIETLVEFALRHLPTQPAQP